MIYGKGNPDFTNPQVGGGGVQILRISLAKLSLHPTAMFSEWSLHILHIVIGDKGQWIKKVTKVKESKQWKEVFRRNLLHMEFRCLLLNSLNRWHPLGPAQCPLCFHRVLYVSLRECLQTQHQSSDKLFYFMVVNWIQNIPTFRPLSVASWNKKVEYCYIQFTKMLYIVAFS